MYGGRGARKRFATLGRQITIAFFKANGKCCNLIMALTTFLITSMRFFGRHFRTC